MAARIDDSASRGSGITTTAWNLAGTRGLRCGSSISLERSWRTELGCKSEKIEQLLKLSSGQDEVLVGRHIGRPKY